MSALSKPQKAGFAHWRRVWRYLNGSARAEQENAFAAGWLAGLAYGENLRRDKR